MSVGSASGDTGSSFAVITTGTRITERLDGSGVASGALACTDTACELCSAITMVVGARSVRTGICGGRTTTTRLGVGSGPAVTDVLAGTNTECAPTSAGLALVGSQSDTCGDCGGGTDTTTVCMAVHAGLGVVTSALDTICTATATCGATIRAAGAACDHIGTCGRGITTTDRPDGSGEEPAELVVTSTDSASTAGGLAQSGSKFVHIGTCTAKTITTTGIMVVASGAGPTNTSALGCTGTGTEFCMSTTRAAGVVPVATGNSSVATITTNQIVGSGAASKKLDATSIVCAH